jgi:uncharacterized protein
MTQKGTYPYDSVVQFDVTAPRHVEFAVSFRIPAWAAGASISVNGKRVTEPVNPGNFATVRRKWKTNDRVEVDLPLAMRLEPVDPRHPKTVALLRGPLVLFAVTDKAPALTSSQLLAAKKAGDFGWRVETATADLKMLPLPRSGTSNIQRISWWNRASLAPFRMTVFFESGIHAG